MVFDDHIEVISSRTGETALKFSPREMIGGHAQEVGVSVNEAEEDIAISGVHTFDDDPCQPLRINSDSMESRASYRAHQQSLSDQWTALRESLLTATIESEGMPNGQLCMVCEIEHACLRCRDCGPNQFFCKGCGVKLHQCRNHFHYMEQWLRGQEFCPFMEQPVPHLTSTRMWHKDCCSRSVQMVIVVDFHGRQHLANIELCSCQDDALFFVQQGLWPASPCKPQFCFQFKFLDRVESLLLENQTSLKGFCDGIKEALPKLIKDNV